MENASESYSRENYNQQFMNTSIIEEFMLNQSINPSISRICNFYGSKDEDFSLWFEDLKMILKDIL
jgi:hypothetical protein